MWRIAIEDGVGSSAENQTSRFEPELREFRGAREQLGVDVELPETADDPGNNLISMVTYRPGSMSDSRSKIRRDWTYRWVCWLLMFSTRFSNLISAAWAV